MDSTSPPPYQKSEPTNRTKSASRLSKLRYYNEENEEVVTPNLSLEIVPSSPTVIASPSPTKSPRGLPVHELILLSRSPFRKSKTRLADRLELPDDVAETDRIRRRSSKNRSSGSNGLLPHPSPRNHRRSRRRFELDVREDKDFCPGEDLVKPRKKRHSGKPKKDKLSFVTSVPSPKTNYDEGCNLDGIRNMIFDLIMWKDVAKSTLWFGFGSMCFLSSCFTKGISFSIFSVMSQLGLLFLGLSFFSNSVRQRDMAAKKTQFKLRDEDILKVGRFILPAANLIISKAMELFSGEPAMTLKVVPFLLLGAEYGHLLTLWRLCALGFFVSFTFPKLYSSYSAQLCRKAEYVKSWVLEAWGTCSHKKIVAASAVTAFWNMTSIRTRIFAAFICLVILKYHRQQSQVKIEENTAADPELVDEQQQQQALIVVESESKK